MGEKVADEHGGSGGLGQSRGQRRPPHAPAEAQDEQGVQRHIHQAAGQHAHGADLGRAVGLYLNLQIVGYGEEDGKDGDGAHVFLHILQRVRRGPQKQGCRLQIQQNGRRQQQADRSCHRQGLVEVIAGLLQLPPAQGDGDDGGCAGGQQNTDHIDQRGEGHGQVYRRHGRFAHAPGHKDPVHNGVEGEDPHGCDGRQGKFQKFFTKFQE